MKVSDVMKSLEKMDPESEIVLKHLYASPKVVMTKIRVYSWEGRVVIDGYQREAPQSNEEG
mgnify:CR=1 FL=1|tara:strand:- start:316 stop:498 length:183 start_codon:yes stop_codon:yes gene_type:complete